MIWALMVFFTSGLTLFLGLSNGTELGDTYIFQGKVFEGAYMFYIQM